MGSNSDPTRMPGIRLYHFIAWILAILVFPLIWVGGLVTTSDAGMAVPDWPGTYGYNMFAYPLSAWYYGPMDLYLEHGHRLLASIVGLICIGLFVTSFFVPWKQLRWLSGLALVLVILQGLLGGFRVELQERGLALIHGFIGPGFFGFVILLVVISSNWWHRAGLAQWWTSEASKGGLSNKESKLLGSMWEKLWIARSVAVVTAVLAYVQLILGANVRHIPEMPMATPEQFRVLVWFHVMMALALVVSISLLFLRNVGPVPGLHRSRWLLVALITLQMLLGFGTWVVKYGWPEYFDGIVVADHFRVEAKNYWQIHIVTAHVAIGSLIFGTSVWCAARLWRAEYCAGELLTEQGYGQWQELSKRHLPLYHT